MRQALLTLLLAACGRLDFAPHTHLALEDAAGLDGADGSTEDVMAGCALHLPMDEASWTGTNAVVDTCHGFRGTAAGNAEVASDPVRGTVGNFVGDTSCVQIPDAPELRGGPVLTLSAWVRPAQLSPAGFGVISKRTDFSVNNEYSAFIWADTDGAGSTNELYLDIATTRKADLGQVYADNVWHQFTIVYDNVAAQAHVYVDGALSTDLEEPAAIMQPAVEPPLSIGCLPLGGPAQGLVGQLDEVAIWNRALTVADVATWYQRTRK